MSNPSDMNQSDSNPADRDPAAPKAKGHRGHEAHGGDVAPPNDDQAGRRQSPQGGTPVKH